MNQVESTAAWATLYDAVSVAFGYPSQRLYDALSDGSFMQVIAEAASTVQGLASERQALDAAVAEVLAGRGLLDLETEYVSLFEINRRERPLHLYAHLYAPQNRDSITLMRRLQALYRDHGVALKTGEGADHPDHLTVQLEFMAYLYHQLGRVLAGEQQGSAAELGQAVAAFRQELVWIPVLCSELEQRSGHPFYVPLCRFLIAMLAHGRPPAAEAAP